MTKIDALAAQWTHGIKGAKKRLREAIESGERFDARDRQALAFLLIDYEWHDYQEPGH